MLFFCRVACKFAQHTSSSPAYHCNGCLWFVIRVHSRKSVQEWRRLKIISSSFLQTVFVITFTWSCVCHLSIQNSRFELANSPVLFPVQQLIGSSLGQKKLWCQKVRPYSQQEPLLFSSEIFSLFCVITN